jgi:uncharacterized protein
VEPDDLSAPLGQNRTKPPKAALKTAFNLRAPQVMAAGLSPLVFAVAGWGLFAQDPFGGEPMVAVPANLRAEATARTPIEPSPQSPADSTERPNRADVTPSANPPSTKTITIIDGSSGKRQEVIVGNTPDGKTTGLDDRLSETSRHGPLPRVAPDGTRPADAYTRPTKTIPGKPNSPRVAIVVGGLGIGVSATNDAIAKLPGSVTLAFAPYGSENSGSSLL